MYAQLSKKETKELIQTSKRFESWEKAIHIRDPEIEGFRGQAIMSAITSWYFFFCPEHKGGYPNTKITRDGLSKIFGFGPVCQFTTWHKMNVWGLDYDGIKFLVFDSKRGTSFQVEPNATDNQVIKLMDHLFEVLAGSKYPWMNHKRTQEEIK